MVHALQRVLVGPLLTAARWFCGLAFGAFCVLTLVQVVNRYALGLPLFWSEEVALLLFVWSVMAGVPVALWDRQEIAVDMLGLRPGPLASALKGAADAVSVLFLVLLAAAGWMLIVRAGSARTPAADLPRWLSYAAIPVGAALGALAVIGRRFHSGAAAQGTPDTSHADYAHD